MISWKSTSDRTLVQSDPVHPYGRQRSTSSCQGGWGVPPAGGHRQFGLASILTWSQSDRACLKNATGGDFATSSPTNDSRITWKCHNWTVEQSWDGSHPETDWKHETPLPGCDWITWVTHKLLKVVASGIWTVWTCSWHGVTLWNLHFGGMILYWQNACNLLFKFGRQHWNSWNKHVLEYMPCLVFAWYPWREI